MTAFCSSCRKTVQCKKLRGRAECCGGWNSLTKLPSLRVKERKHGTEGTARVNSRKG